jgi:uroporphyrin-III C-methyltransferase
MPRTPPPRTETTAFGTPAGTPGSAVDSLPATAPAAHADATAARPPRRPRQRPAGSVTLLGAGPGDPELLTLKAVKALRRATVALVDDLVDPGVLRHLKRGARVVRVGKRGGCISTSQAFIQRLMVAQALAGETVVRVKGGDPFVFGRGGEEADALRAAGIDVQVVGGLTAGIAGPAAAGIAVTDRRHAPGVALVTGHAREGGSGPDWAALARSGLTLVVYMGVAQADAITQALLDAGMDAATPAAVVSAAHTPRQRQAACTLGRLADTVRERGLVSPAVLVVGEVVRAAPLWATFVPEVPRGISRIG